MQKNPRKMHISDPRFAFSLHIVSQFIIISIKLFGNAMSAITSSSLNYLCLDKINNKFVSVQPYPHLIIENFISPEKIRAVCRDFPDVSQPGSFPVADLNCSGEFAGVIKELESPDFRDCLAEKFELDLSNRPTMITVRGYSRFERDGRIHTDSKSKLITVLIYFNETWDAPSGMLRILNSNNMDDYHAEVSPLAGTCIIFKVTDNCWHGYPEYKGIRRAIQLNFVDSQESEQKHLFRHHLSAKLKGFKKIFTAN